MSNDEDPLVTIIVPVFNEESIIKRSLTKLFDAIEADSYSDKSWPTEIIIVDDGSTDRSHKIILKMVRNKKIVQILQHNTNQGKGAALSSALNIAKGNFCIIYDADLEYDPYEIRLLIGPLIQGEAHVVFGSRFLKLNKYNGLWFNLLGNKILSLMGSILIRRRITDIMTCYKAFKPELLQDLRARSFDVEPEIAAKLLLNNNHKYLEKPISYNPRFRGKKIKKIDGFISLWRLIKTIMAIQYNQRKNQKIG